MSNELNNKIAEHFLENHEESNTAYYLGTNLDFKENFTFGIDNKIICIKCGNIIARLE